MAECSSLAELMSYFSDKSERLKRCVELRGAGDSSTCLAVLRSIDTELKEVEGVLEGFKSRCMKLEKQKLEQGKALRVVLPQYMERLNHISSHLPSHLPGANAEGKRVQSKDAEATPSVKASNMMQEKGKISRKHGRALDQSLSKTEHSQCPVKISYLTMKEFETVPKYIKGRINYNQVNKAIDEIHKVIGSKYKILKIPRTAMGEPMMKKYKAFKEAETAETAGQFFFIAEDLKNYSQMKVDATGRTALAVLRASGRLKELRGGGLLRYVIQM